MICSGTYALLYSFSSDGICFSLVYCKPESRLLLLFLLAYLLTSLLILLIKQKCHYGPVWEPIRLDVVSTVCARNIQPRSTPLVRGWFTVPAQISHVKLLSALNPQVNLMLCHVTNLQGNLARDQHC